MVSASLPIKCLEAVVLGIQQTMNLENLDRITLSFKSVCDGIVYRHIVLVLKYFDKWGALGLSRRPDLMNKTLTYRTLSDLIHEYKICYENNFHKLLKVKLGWPVAHNLASNEAPTWKHTCIYIQQPWSDVMKEVDSYCRLLRSR
ncbi:VASH2 protein [Globomyces pollinis-pini]|nr:VASH2 protein [Globomyces pollinis-pini]